MVIWNPPDVTPFRVPLRVNPPVAMAPGPKQGLVVVKCRLVMLRLLPPVCRSVTLNANAGEPLAPAFVSAAVQLPLILPDDPELPHAASSSTVPSTRIVPAFFISAHTPFEFEICPV